MTPTSREFSRIFLWVVVPVVLFGAAACGVKTFSGSASESLSDGPKSTKTYYYVSNSGDDSISVFELTSAETAQLKSVRTHKLSVAGAAPGFVHAEKAGETLFVAQTGSSPGVHTFRISPDGTLTFLNSGNLSPNVAAGPLDLSLTERMLVASGGGRVTSFARDVDGALNRISFESAGNPLLVVRHPKLNLFYSLDSTANTITAFRTQLRGEIQEVATYSSGANIPKWFALHPSGTVALAVHAGFLVGPPFGTDSRIQSFRVNSSGALTPAQATNSNNDQESEPTFVVFHPNLNVFYVFNSRSKNISTYSLNVDTAQFSLLGAAVPIGAETISATLDPSGRVLSAITTDQKVEVYSVNPTDGTLTTKGELSVGASPKFGSFAVVPQ